MDQLEKIKEKINLIRHYNLYNPNHSSRNTINNAITCIDEFLDGNIDFTFEDFRCDIMEYLEREKTYK